ncbi:MAG: RuvX/YqgF family protein [bacterium]|nr:RuvX/YqgF family protein [bacterium]
MHYLGLDYGESHVGVALAEGNLAEPLDTISRKSALQLIKQLVVKHQIEELVVGECPDQFLNDLAGLGLPVHTVDETLSSQDAIQMLLHTTKIRRKNLQHAAAATVILQNWLDFQDTSS